VGPLGRGFSDCDDAAWLEDGPVVLPAEGLEARLASEWARADSLDWAAVRRRMDNSLEYYYYYY
jgi:hypothetical protein